MNNRFSFSFVSFTWKNLRRKIRSLSSESVWFRVLSSLLQILSERSTRASWLYNQIWLESSSDYGLTLWGQRYGIPRLLNETDSDYKDRIFRERMFVGNGATNASRKKAIAFILGIPTTQIEIKQIRNFFGCGGVIGSPVGDLDYLKHIYRIYITGVENPEPTQIEKLFSILDSINVGGNVPELWFEKTVGYANRRVFNSKYENPKSYEVFK